MLKRELDKCLRRFELIIKVKFEIFTMYINTEIIIFTFLSMSLSHISLMVQPAPLITIAPRPNKPRTSKLGSCPAVDAKAILHVHGQYKSNHPKNQYQKTGTTMFKTNHKLQTCGFREPHKF